MIATVIWGAQIQLNKQSRCWMKNNLILLWIWVLLKPNSNKHYSSFHFILVILYTVHYHSVPSPPIVLCLRWHGSHLVLWMKDFYWASKRNINYALINQLARFQSHILHFTECSWEGIYPECKVMQENEHSSGPCASRTCNEAFMVLACSTGPQKSKQNT